MPRNPESGPADSPGWEGNRGLPGLGAVGKAACGRYKEPLLGSRCGPYVTGAGVWEEGGGGGAAGRSASAGQGRPHPGGKHPPCSKTTASGRRDTAQGLGPDFSLPCPSPIQAKGPDGIPPHELRPQHPVSAEAPSPLPSLVGPVESLFWKRSVFPAVESRANLSRLFL